MLQNEIESEVEETRPALPNDCKGCGACCMNYRPEYVYGAWLTETEYCKFLIKMPSLIEILVLGTKISVKLRLTKDKRCIVLSNDNVCTIYEERPQICKDFVKGSRLCRKHLERK